MTSTRRRRRFAEDANSESQEVSAMNEIVESEPESVEAEPESVEAEHASEAPTLAQLESERASFAQHKLHLEKLEKLYAESKPFRGYRVTGRRKRGFWAAGVQHLPGKVHLHSIETLTDAQKLELETANALYLGVERVGL